VNFLEKQPSQNKPSSNNKPKGMIFGKKSPRAAYWGSQEDENLKGFTLHGCRLVGNHLKQGENLRGFTLEG